MPRRQLVLTALAVALLVLGPGSGTAASAAGDAKAPAQLPAQYRPWLDEVKLLISKQELQTFLALEKDYQRDGFIHRFWEARNPYPGSARNAFKEQWEVRLAKARQEYGNIAEDRARMLLLHGEPGSVLKTDCGALLWPVEVWFYPVGDRMPRGFYLIFWQPSAGGTYRLWRLSDGAGVLLSSFRSALVEAFNQEVNWLIYELQHRCPVDGVAVERALRYAISEEQSAFFNFLEAPPPPRDREWLSTFHAVSTDLPAAAPSLAARLELSYPRRERERTVVAALLRVPKSGAQPAGGPGGSGSYDFLVEGEVLHGTELVESFRYSFGLPASTISGAEIPLVFERLLWPGEYTLIVRLEDLHSHAGHREEQPLEVPAIAEAKAASAAAPSAAALARASPAIKLIPPEGDLQSGAVRLDAEVAGDPEAIRKVTFFLDGKEMLTKARPPFGVELNLGKLPRSREVRAVAYDAAGREVASDTLLLNAPKQRFAVRLLEPQAGVAYRGRVTARAEVRLPDGASLERLELFANDDRVATLYQPPFVQTVPLPAAAGPTVVRAVGYLADGSSTEDLVVVNAPEASERLDVRLVELYASVLDGSNRPVRDLARGDFKVLEDGKEQTLLRFEQVTDLPVHLLLVIDTSASMAHSLPQVQKAALAFVERLITPRDRAALLTFSDTPVLRSQLTSDHAALALALAGLHAERGTAFFDSLVYGLSYMKGIHGQAALLLFTDGDDHLSHLGFDEALAFARRSGVAIYAVGAQVSRLDLQARGRLSKLASETGGRSIFIDSAAELEAVYAAIEQELRARYLLAYQSQNTARDGAFRSVDVRVAGAGREVKTIRGYYP
ncbi:MAG TPA: VWA domain-containing protein [Thermoanaerobaculia bacterium]|nr:VWA domain-containing protein [Thermoanaerobaculia bacterium]